MPATFEADRVGQIWFFGEVVVWRMDEPHVTATIEFRTQHELEEWLKAVAPHSEELRMSAGLYIDASFYDREYGIVTDVEVKPLREGNAFIRDGKLVKNWWEVS